MMEGGGVGREGEEKVRKGKDNQVEETKKGENWEIKSDIDLEEGKRAHLTLRLHKGWSVMQTGQSLAHSSPSTGLVREVEFGTSFLHSPNFPTRRHTQEQSWLQFFNRTVVSGILPASSSIPSFPQLLEAWLPTQAEAVLRDMIHQGEICVVGDHA